jgi:hypothetical protein
MLLFIHNFSIELFTTAARLLYTRYSVGETTVVAVANLAPT